MGNPQLRSPRWDSSSIGNLGVAVQAGQSALWLQLQCLWLAEELQRCAGR